MKRIFFIALLFLIIYSATEAYAQDIQDLTGRSSIGIAAGGAFPKDEDVENSWTIGGNYAYSFNNYFALGVEAGYASWEVDVDGIELGDMRAIPLLADFYLRYPINTGEYLFLPYAIGGIGVIFWDFDESSLLESVGASVDMDNELGIKAGGGFDFFVTKDLALNVESYYVWSDPDATATVAGTSVSDSIEADYWSVTGGIKFYI